MKLRDLTPEEDAYAREHYHMSRQDSIKLATYARQVGNAASLAASASNTVDLSVVWHLHLWAQLGGQSALVPHTYAAALMASDARGALKDVELPWPAFEIQVPVGLLYGSHGVVTSVQVCKIPDLFNKTGPHPDHQYSIAYLDDKSWGVNTYANLGQMVDDALLDDYASDSERDLTEFLAEDYDPDIEKRLWKLLGRLVTGVALTIRAARAERPGIYRALPYKEKRGVMKPNTHRLGNAVKVDCRPAIAAFLAGERRQSPTETVLVEGHWKNQAYGPQWSLRKQILIEPYYRGPLKAEMEASRA